MLGNLNDPRNYVLGVAFAAALFAPFHAAQAKSGFASVYGFSGPDDGANPRAALIRQKGEYFGTTFYGGSGASGAGMGCDAGGCGTVFELAASGAETVLYNFCSAGGTCVDGASPVAALVMDKKGRIFGTTAYGGGGNCSVNGSIGCGTVFELSPNADGSWTEQVLYAFQGGSDGNQPYSGLIADSSGNLYGTTFLGGNMSNCQSGCGVVYELTPSGKHQKSWTETVLYAFTGSGDGAFPALGNLFADGSGNLYGTTTLGGNNGTGCTPLNTGCGVVYELTPPAQGRSTAWTENVLYAFAGSSDGGYPYSGVIADSSGNLYGATGYGGNITTDCPSDGSRMVSPYPGCGVVYKLTSPGNGQTPWPETVLYTFAGESDGGYPVGGLIADSDGTFYGTTSAGGNQTNCPGNASQFEPGCGVVYKLTPRLNGQTPWKEKVLYTFAGQSDGANPYASLLLEGNWLYGGAVFGGNFPPACSTNSNIASYGCGTVFKVRK